MVKKDLHLYYFRIAMKIHFPPLDEMLGQMLLVGFRGVQVDETSPIVKDIQRGIIGGVILFDKDVELGTDLRNFERFDQVEVLNESLKRFSKTKLFISVDQEGGKVCRLRGEYGYPATISQQGIGDYNSIKLTVNHSSIIARALYYAGFNLNFAPVVDLNINPDCPVIGKLERSFSSEPEMVIKHSSIFIDEHRRYKIACVPKHFPGHGSAKTDTHFGIADVTDTWTERELEPYIALIASGKLDCVMTAHIFNSKLDPDYPATLSEKIIGGILRKQLGFEGVVFSDDMNMKAISSHFSIELAIERAITAGVDVLVFANNSIYDENIAEKAHGIMKRLIDEGKITIERIEESYHRIMKLKVTL
ncbi:MAG: glycoside hydrolase family 3 domain protein [Ignavibacteria bacterium]|nr:glycoside hydrolase family 3 domain protein [Ignavibacteria bacterium]